MRACLLPSQAEALYPTFPPLTKGREKNPRTLAGLQAVDLASPNKGESRAQL